MLNRYHVILVIASVVTLLSAAAVITLIVLWQTSLSPFQDYSIVIDAGSTGSRIYLYTWPADKSDGLGTTSRITQVKSCNVPFGPLASINLSETDSVRTYFDTAMSNCTSEIPATRKSRSLIFLGATAGLRLTNLTNPTYVSNLLNQTRSYFSTLGLLFLSPENQVRIISGSEEGLSGWITTNMLENEFFDDDSPLDTFGVFDMGGASTQITFIAPSAMDHRYTLNLFDVNYDVYSYSYLCYGQNQLRFVYQGVLIQRANGNTIADDPCLPAGFNETISYDAIISTPCAEGKYVAPTNINSSTNVTFRGTGDYTQCQVLMRERFDKTSCARGSTCSFDGVYQPTPVSSPLKFIAISAFYSTFATFAPYISVSADSQRNFQLSSTDLTQIYAAIQTICNQPWANVTNPDPFRPFLCFNSMFHWTLFADAYSFTTDNVKNFQVVRTINSTTIGWSLGYMINQTNFLDAEYRPARLLTRAEFIGIIICFVVVLVIGLILTVLSIFLLRRRGIKRVY